MRIGEVAQRAGLRTSAIRYYEAAGVLPVPDRAGGRRTYDESVLSRLAVIRFAQAGAFTLDEIRELFSERTGERLISARWKRLATAKLVELDAVIARAEAMKRELREALRCGCVEVEECGRTLLRHRSVAGPLHRTRLPRRKVAADR
jgi:MerR family redox-sensitive transcriptional activator SoxR